MIHPGSSVCPSGVSSAPCPGDARPPSPAQPARGPFSAPTPLLPPLTWQGQAGAVAGKEGPGEGAGLREGGGCSSLGPTPGRVAAGPPTNASRCSLAVCATSSSPPPAALWGSRPPAWHKEGFMRLDGPGGWVVDGGGQREVGRMTPGRREQGPPKPSPSTHPHPDPTAQDPGRGPESSKPTPTPHPTPGHGPGGVSSGLRGTGSRHPSSPPRAPSLGTSSEDPRAPPHCL